MAATAGTSAPARRRLAQVRRDCLTVTSRSFHFLPFHCNAGALGGTLGVFAGHPLDTLRTRQQQPSSPAGLRAVWAATVQQEGVRALFKGASGPLATSAIGNAICFHVYHAAGRSITGTEAGPSTYAGMFAAGCASGAATTALVTPVDVLKIRSQVHVGKVQGPLALTAAILSTEGVRGLFRGAGITFLRDTPSTGIYYVAYEGARDLAGNRGAGTDAATLCAGALAGVTSWLSIYPLDVVKSRIQASPGRYAGMLDCARRSLREGGPAVFARGLPACLLRAALVNAAIFGGYEAGIELLRTL